MVEQKPEIKIDPEGYSDRGAGVLGQTNRKLGRLGSFLRKHPTAQKIAAIGAFVGLGGIATAEVAGCGSGEAENTTNPSGITSTQVPETELSSTTIPYATTEGNNTTTNTTRKTTTTEVPTTTEIRTTTTEALTTTTTDEFSEVRGALVEAGLREDAYDGLFSNTTFEEAKKYMEIPEYKTLREAVLSDLQKAFQSVHPDKKIVYIGKANRGLEMNAVITTLPYTPVGGSDFPEDFFGGLEYPGIKGGYMTTIGEFQGLVPIPQTPDCLVELRSPFYENPYFIRISLGLDERVESRFDLFDLKKRIQPEASGEIYYISNILKTHKANEFLQIGDILQIEGETTGSYKNDSLTVVKDKYGWPIGGHFTETRFEGIEELKKIYD